jgi:hypothetical protein
MRHLKRQKISKEAHNAQNDANREATQRLAKLRNQYKYRMMLVNNVLIERQYTSVPNDPQDLICALPPVVLHRLRE